MEHTNIPDLIIQKEKEFLSQFRDVTNLTDKEIDELFESIIKYYYNDKKNKKRTN